MSPRRRRCARATRRAALTALLALLPLLPARAGAWTTAVNGLAPPADLGRAVAADGLGNVVVLGSTNDLGTGSALTVVKIDPAGRELWRQHVTGTALRSGEDGAEPGGIAVDAAGDVVVVGAVPQVGTQGDFAVVKLAGATGAEWWRTVIDGTAHARDRARGVALDPLGNVVAIGELLNQGTSRDVLVVKLVGTTGGEAWRTVFDGAAHASDTPGAVAVDAAGDVAVAASLHNGPGGRDFTVARLSGATGVPLWGPVHVDEGSSDAANAVAVDRDGNLVAAGVLRGPGGDDDFAVLKFSTTGAEIWRAFEAGSAHDRDEARAVAVDFAGDVLAAGTVTTLSGGRDLTLVKLRWSDGHRLWLQPILGSAGGDDAAEAVAVDTGGNVVVAGRTVNVGSGGDLTVARYTPAGVPVWVRALAHGPEYAYETAAALAVTPSGVVATGTSIGDTSSADVHTVMIAAVSGDVLWQHTVNGTGTDSVDAGEAVAVDGAGHVIAAGATSNTAPVGMAVAVGGAGPGHFTVVSVDGATGTIRWRRDLSGTTAEPAAAAMAVAVDAAGDVVAGGTMRNAGSATDFTVSKLRGGDGTEAWRSTISGSDRHEIIEAARAVAIDAAGGVIAAGAIGEGVEQQRFFVRALDGTSGAERWARVVTAEHPLDETGDTANAMVLDPAGDVVAGGVVSSDEGGPQDFVVVKLSADTGAVRWRALVDGGVTGDGCNAVAADAAGNVVAAGRLGKPGGSWDFFVLKVDGGSGAERWHVLLDGDAAMSHDTATAVRVDVAGDVVVTGALAVHEDLTQYVVLKLAGASGAELWRAEIAGGATGRNRGVGLMTDAVGDVISVGQLEVAPGILGLFATRLLGATGTALWQRTIHGTANRYADAAGVALDAGGNAAIVGNLENAGTATDFTVAKISGTTGGDAFCGDGVQDAGERCDDGNSASGDCCSPACQPTEVPGACGAPCASAEDCDNADPCTTGVCDATSHCVQEPVVGDAAMTCAFARPLAGPCARVPRAIRKAFARAGGLVGRAVAVERPSRRQMLYARASRLLRKTARLLDRAERSRRPGRRLTAACAAALRAIVVDARARVDRVREQGAGRARRADGRATPASLRLPHGARGAFDG